MIDFDRHTVKLLGLSADRKMLPRRKSKFKSIQIKLVLKKKTSGFF